jgi:hypothetical protein
MFRQILRSLAEKVSKEAREAILKLSAEAIRDYVPYSKGRMFVAAVPRE